MLSRLRHLAQIGFNFCVCWCRPGRSAVHRLLARSVVVIVLLV